MSYKSKYSGQEIDNLLSQVENNSVEKVELLNEELVYALGSGQTLVNQTITLKNSIENYDLLVFEFDYYWNDGYGMEASQVRIPTNIIYNPTNERVLNGSQISLVTADNTSHYIIDVWFKSGTELFVHRTSCKQQTVSITKGRIRSITGIKLKASGGINSGESVYSETELLDTPADYTLKTSATILNTNLTLNDDIANYDEIVFDCALVRSSDGSTFVLGQTRVLVSTVSYNTNSDYTKVTDGSNLFLNVVWNGGSVSIATCQVYFKNGNTLAIAFTVCNNGNYNYFRIRSIKGIKY